MEILNLILGLIIAVLGLPIGFILAKIAKEELKPGKKYFKWMQGVILVLTPIFIVFGAAFNMSMTNLYVLFCSMLFLLGLPTAALWRLK